MNPHALPTVGQFDDPVTTEAFHKAMSFDQINAVNDSARKIAASVTYSAEVFASLNGLEGVRLRQMRFKPDTPPIGVGCMCRALLLFPIPDGDNAKKAAAIELHVGQIIQWVQTNRGVSLISLELEGGRKYAGFGLDPGFEYSTAIVQLYVRAK